MFKRPRVMRNMMAVLILKEDLGRILNPRVPRLGLGFNDPVDFSLAPAAARFGPHRVAFSDGLALLVFDLGGGHCGLIDFSY